MRQRLLIIGVFLLALIPPARFASARERCFDDKTVYCLNDQLLEYWEINGGLPVFGYPITGVLNEVNSDTNQRYETQWTERNRFEIHPENTGTPYEVLLGLLGKDRLRQLGRDPDSEPRESGPKPGCLWFEQTGHNVCNQRSNLGFKTYWESHGLKIDNLDKYARSLQLFGLPLTEATMETNSSGDTVLTQWFERARFEWHPNNPDEFTVLLGRLGSEIRMVPVQDLNQARARWASQGLRSYDFELSVFCFCPRDLQGPVIVAVRDGVPVSITNPDTGQPVDARVREWYEHYDTVDDLFAIIEDALNRNAVYLEVIYDPTLGYPISVVIDYDARMVDEELALQVTQLKRIP